MKLNIFKVFIATVFSFAFLSGCTEKELLIRVNNVSDFDFQDVYVNTNGGENNYGDIKSGKASDYMMFDFAYRYAFIELKINDTVYTLQPIDYVGEVKLDPGKYSYEVDALPSGGQFGQISVELVEE